MKVRAAVVVFVALSMNGVATAQTPTPTPSPAGAPAPPTYEETVEVVAATPIHGLGIARDKMPSNIQSATAGDLGRTGGVQLAEQIHLASPSVHVNEATTSPFQPDLQFRGFTGSPLLGLPQGIAVYQEGVRLNEPFGDTVNWDLLPGNAVAGITLMPGSNPLFGLNALGGAISLQTKTGFSHPGHAARVSSGSFGRQTVEAESGGRRGGLSYFVAGAAIAEDGWRDFSPSRVRQLFGDLEWRGAGSMLNASVTSGRNTLIGNGTAPIELLDENRRAIFTYPDETRSRMTLLTVRGQHTPASRISLDGMFFFRRATINTFNGDDSDYDACEAAGFEEFLCADEGDGEPVEDQFERLRPGGRRRGVRRHEQHLRHAHQRVGRGAAGDHDAPGRRSRESLRGRGHLRWRAVALPGRYRDRAAHRCARHDRQRLLRRGGGGASAHAGAPHRGLRGRLPLGGAAGHADGGRPFQSQRRRACATRWAPT